MNEIKKDPTLRELVVRLRALEQSPEALDQPAARAELCTALRLVAEQLAALIPCPHVTQGPRQCSECRAKRVDVAVPRPR